MTLGGQGHDTPLSSVQQLCEILSRSNFAVRSYGLDTDFGYECTVSLTLEIWPWVKVMTHPWVMDNKCLNIIQIQLCSEELWPGHGFWVCALWPWPWRYDLGSRSWHTLGSCTIIVLNIIQIGQVGTELWIRHEVNRRTDRQGDSFIPPKLCRGGGGYKNRCKW